MDPNDQNTNGQGPVTGDDTGAGDAGVPAGGSMPSTPPSTDDIGGGDATPEITPPNPAVPEEGAGGDEDSSSGQPA